MFQKHKKKKKKFGFVFSFGRIPCLNQRIALIFFSKGRIVLINNMLNGAFFGYCYIYLPVLTFNKLI